MLGYFMPTFFYSHVSIILRSKEALNALTTTSTLTSLGLGILVLSCVERCHWYVHEQHLSCPRAHVS
jgi:hypothetical protein